MECAAEATPHEETCIYSSVLEGGNLMHKLKDDELQNTAVDGDEQREQDYPIRAGGKYVAVPTPWPRDEVKEARDIASATKRKPFTHPRQGNRWDQYRESSSAASSEAHITSHEWTMYIVSRLGVHMSLPTETNGQLNPIDLPATMAHGRRCLIGKDHNSPPRQGGP